MQSMRSTQALRARHKRRHPWFGIATGTGCQLVHDEPQAKHKANDKQFCRLKRPALACATMRARLEVGGVQRLDLVADALQQRLDVLNRFVVHL